MAARARNTRTKPPEEETNPGVLVTSWYELKADYDESVEELNDLAVKMNSLADLLRVKFSIAVGTIGSYNSGVTEVESVESSNEGFVPPAQLSVDEIRSTALVGQPDDMGSEAAFADNIASVLNRVEGMIKF